MGYWYNGYYSRLLICQIGVRIPGGPFTWIYPGVRIPGGPFARGLFPGDLHRPILLTVQVSTFSVWGYGFESRWGDCFCLIRLTERTGDF